jgi:hypothetical protein
VCEREVCACEVHVCMYVCSMYECALIGLNTGMCEIMSHNFQYDELASG